MNSQNKKQFLSQYLPLAMEIKRNKEELRRWREFSDSLQKDSPDLQTAVANIELIEQRLNRQIKSLIKLRLQIETAIAGLNDATLRLIMQRRYLDNKQFFQIAREVHYSTRHVERLHGAALAKIKIKDVASCRK